MNLNNPLVLATALFGAAASFAHPGSVTVIGHEHLVFTTIETVMRYTDGTVVTWTLDPKLQPTLTDSTQPTAYEVKIVLPSKPPVNYTAVLSLASLGIQGIDWPVQIVEVRSKMGTIEYAPSVYADANGIKPQFTPLNPSRTKPQDIRAVGLNGNSHADDNNIGVLRFKGDTEFVLVVLATKARHSATTWDAPHASGHDNIPPGSTSGAPE